MLDAAMQSFPEIRELFDGLACRLQSAGGKPEPSVGRTATQYRVRPELQRQFAEVQKSFEQVRKALPPPGTLKPVHDALESLRRSLPPGELERYERLVHEQQEALVQAGIFEPISDTPTEAELTVAPVSASPAEDIASPPARASPHMTGAVPPGVDQALRDLLNDRDARITVTAVAARLFLSRSHFHDKYGLTGSMLQRRAAEIHHTE